MRHQKLSSKFHRDYEARKKLKVDLARSLILSGKIITFSARAKWFRSFFDRIVTLSKRAKGDEKLIYHRLRKYFNEQTSKFFIKNVLPKLSTRNSGYTKIYKLQDKFGASSKSIVVLATDEN